jgi:hypothetical protein
MKPGRAGTMTHDYKRNGTTTLFAALNILDGTVIASNMQRYRHQEFIRFLNTIEAQVPKRKKIHAIVDNCATRKHNARPGRRRVAATGRVQRAWASGLGPEADCTCLMAATFTANERAVWCYARSPKVRVVRSFATCCDARY